MHPDERWSGAVCILDTIILSQKPSAGGITDTLTIVFMYNVHGQWKHFMSVPYSFYCIACMCVCCVYCTGECDKYQQQNRSNSWENFFHHTAHFIFSIRLKKNPIESILFVLRIQCLCMSFNIVELHLLKTDIIAHLIATQFRIRPKPKGNESSYILFD